VLISRRSETCNCDAHALFALRQSLTVCMATAAYVIILLRAGGSTLLQLHVGVLMGALFLRMPYTCTYAFTGMYFGTDLDDLALKKQQQQQADTSSSSTLYDITDDDDDMMSVIGTNNTPVSLPRLTAQSRLELEVTYEVFLAAYWPKMVSKFNSINETVMKLDPSLVWTEIRSHIKGSTDALSSAGKLRHTSKYATVD
jgi:hypothetical protein